MTEEQRAEWRRIARMNVRGDPISVVFTKKPDLEQANRKSLAFMSPLQRSNPYHYDEIVNEDLRNNFTPLNIRKLIDQLREAQREEIAARQAADPSWQPPQDLHPDGTVDAAATATTGREPAASIEFDDELEDDDEGEREGDEKGERIAVGGFFSNKWGGGSSRDQNVGTGVTYPEYLLWRSKRKQQQQDGQQLDALKNSLNIQLRNARRVASVTESTQHEDLEHHGGEEDAALTEEQFAALGTASDLAKATGGDVQRAMHRDYSAANTEVDFILSRSNSHLDALGAIQRKFSSKKRTSVGSSLHFNTAALMSGNNAPGAETEEGSAATEAGRRARGESMMSARASLSLRARASLLGKLNRALESIESKMSEDSPGRRASSRLSVLNKLSTISERPSARSSIVRHSSMLKPTAIPELQLKEARDIANSIIHGKPVKDGGDKKERHSTADPGFDMQILEYIANDQLIMSGWESVDLFKMNDNETFSGHSFKFDDQDDRARAATLKEFTKQVASRSETSASAVESEFRAAIVNLNRLVGKKISDTAVLDAPPAPQHEQQAEPEAEGAPLGASGSARSVRTEKTSEASLLPRAQLHKDQSTVGFSRSNSECGAEEVTTSTTPAAVPAEGVDPPPHRPQEPKPSATFASPRRKVFLADPSSLIF